MKKQEIQILSDQELGTASAGILGVFSINAFSSNSLINVGAAVAGNANFGNHNTFMVMDLGRFSSGGLADIGGLGDWWSGYTPVT